MVESVMDLGVAWLVASTLSYSFTQVYTCNVQQINDFIRSRLNQVVDSDCGHDGDKCQVDRDCCEGWECRMSVTFEGNIDTYCTNESTGDDFWLVADPWSYEDSDLIKEAQTTKYSHSLDHNIREIQEKKRLELQRENKQLERLFTEKDEEDLEKLRAIKEDMELDELRSLKELRLKRKLQLLKELRELKANQSEKTSDILYQKGKNTIGVEPGAVIRTNSSEVVNKNNQSIPAKEYSQEEVENNVDQASPNTTQSITGETLEQNLPKHKQNNHQHHHKKKHPRKHKLRPNINSTDV